MNAQVTFKLDIFNLETEQSAEALANQIESAIEPIILKTINANAQNGSWVYEFEAFVKENIPVSDTAKQVFEGTNNISIGEHE